MELDARDIHTKQFHDAWRGYNQEEVDDFLDDVAAILDRVQRENRQLFQRIKELEEHVAQARDAEEVLKKTLLNAEKAAEEAIETARSKAERMISEANRRNESLERDHSVRKRDLDESIARLKKVESDLKNKLGNFLEDQLRTLRRLDSHPEPPAAPEPRQAAAPETRSSAAPLRATPSRAAMDEREDGEDLGSREERAKVRSFSWRQNKQ